MCPPPDIHPTDAQVRRFALADIALAVALAGLAAFAVGVVIAAVGRALRWMLGPW